MTAIANVSINPTSPNDFTIRVWRHDDSTFAAVDIGSTTIVANTKYPGHLDPEQLAASLRSVADQLDAEVSRLRVEQQHQPLFADEASLKVLDGVARFKESIR